MSNVEKWDHSGYKELQNEEKSYSMNNKRQGDPKKNNYKYKEGNNLNEKMTSDFMEGSYRKNSNKKYSNYNTNKYNNEVWDEKEKEKFNHNMEVDSNNSFKNKQKKKKKDEGYSNSNQGNYEIKEDNYFSKNIKTQEENIILNRYENNNTNRGGPINNISGHQNNKSFDFSNNQKNIYNNNSNYNVPVNNNFSGNFNRKKNNLSMTNNPINGNTNFNPPQYNNPNFYKNNNFLQKSYPNFNPYTNSPYHINSNPIVNNPNTMHHNPNFIPFYQGQNYQDINNKNNNFINTVNEIDINTKIVVAEDESSSFMNDIIVTKHNEIINNETIKNKKMVKNLVETIKSNNKTGKQNPQLGNIDNTNENSNVSPSEETNSVVHTPKRNSMNSSHNGLNTGPNTFNTNSNFTPGNSANFSPKTDQIFMNNILKMPNNFNFNSPMRQINEAFMFNNNQNNVRNIPPMNMNQPYFGMMNTINPSNMMDQSNFQNMSGNITPNMNNPNINHNFNQFFYNNNSHMTNQMKSPINNINQMNINVNNNMNSFNNSKFNNTNLNHNEENYHNDGRNYIKPFSNNSKNTNQFQKGANFIGNNNTNHQIGQNQFEKEIPNNMNNYIHNNKRNTQKNPNNYINTNIQNPGGKNFRKFNNNNNVIMPNFQHNIGRMKFVKSDPDVLRNIRNKNSFKNLPNQNGNNEQNIRMEFGGNINNMTINMNNINDFNNMKLQKNMWRNNKNNEMNINMNQINNNYSNTISNTIKDPNSGNFKNNQTSNNLTGSNFLSIKEEYYTASKNNNENPNEDNYESSENSDYSISVGEKGNEKLNDPSALKILCVSVKLLEREESIFISKNEDVYITARDFVFKHQLDESLIKPITDKIKYAINSIEMIMDYKMTNEESSSLLNVKDYYKEQIEKDDCDIFNQLEFSSISDCACDVRTDSLYLSLEELDCIKRLNLSR